MSVLNFPRIYLGGHMFWNPPTANNNDMYPLYDAVKMQMNWRFLEAFKITPLNAASNLLPWTIAPLAPGKTSTRFQPPPPPHVSMTRSVAPTGTVTVPDPDEKS